MKNEFKTLLSDIREGLGVHQRSVLSDSALRDGRGNAGDRQQGHQDIRQGEPANVGFRNSLKTKKNVLRTFIFAIS